MEAAEQPAKCDDGHIEISFRADGCPLCLLRDEVLLELAQPRTDYERFGLSFTSQVLHEYPFDR